MPGMITEEKLIELIVDKAIGYLEYDDEHPDVGMGMFVSTAMDYAEKDILEEAARWNSLAALKLNFTDDIRATAALIIREKRRR
jgi:uncharacterized protein (DUF1786 family)